MKGWGAGIIVSAVLVGSCVVAVLALPHRPAGPPVDCAPIISSADCQHAIDLARPLLSPEWEKASRVTVHTGPCSRAMKCPATTAANPAFITVELTDSGADTPFAVIDRRPTVWTATCRVMVYSGNSGQLETCKSLRRGGHGIGGG